MEFANFDELMKALDRFYKQSVELNRRIEKDRETAARRAKAAGILTPKQLVAKCKRLERASEKLLKSVQAKERARQARQAAAKSKPSRRRQKGHSDKPAP
jgi:hypothetical protein